MEGDELHGGLYSQVEADALIAAPSLNEMGTGGGSFS